MNKKWYKNSCREFKELKGLDKKHYSSDFYKKNLNYYKIKVGTSLRFKKNKGWINKIILMDGFNGILDIGKEKEVNMEKNC